MKRHWLVTSAFALLIGSFVAAQGAAQGERINWNARAPWGAQSNNRQNHEPFKIFDNVWYVGIDTSSPYLITSAAGHVLFDATWDETADFVLENIRKVGFNPRDIKYLIITHAHTDHFAGAERIRQATGARVGMSLEDWKQTEQLQAAGGQGPQNPGPRIARDLVIEDGQTITLGDQTFKFYVTPGHTPGSTSVEYRARDGNRTYRVLSPGGLGFPNAEWTPAYLKSTQRLKTLGPWDVILPNHPDMMVPRKMRDLEPAIMAHRPGQAHPAVPGAAKLNDWFDAIIKLTNEKIAVESRQPSSSQ